MPDIRVENKYLSSFAVLLYLTGVVEDFGDIYYKQHHTKSIDVKNFSISDKDYADFVAMAMERDIPYKSESRVALENLRSALKKERNDSLEEALAAIDKGLNDDKRSCFETFRADVEEQINQNIVLRYAYAEGVIANSLRSDEELKVAIETLANKAEYERILTSQDTARK